jgi:hypothetical protein
MLIIPSRDYQLADALQRTYGILAYVLQNREGLVSIGSLEQIDYSSYIAYVLQKGRGASSGSSLQKSS